MSDGQNRLNGGNSDTSGTVGVGFIGLLTIVFIGLKLGGIGSVAAWSWWWVLSPIWISILTIFIAIFAGAYILSRIT